MSTRHFLLLLAAVLAVAALYASVKDNAQLRRRIRGYAHAMGIDMSNVVTIVDAGRKRIGITGTVGTTQELGRLLAAMSNFWPRIQYVEQAVTTPEGNPFPPSMRIGEGRVITPAE